MASVSTTADQRTDSLDTLDRVTIVYLSLPLAIFTLGWFKVWLALPLLLVLVYALRFVAAPQSTRQSAHTITRLKIGIAVAFGCAWTVFGGTDHIFFSNADWYTRDAVLHDLVTAAWPVNYGTEDGREIILRAPLGYYLPAALAGKLLGLAAAHRVMALWTAIGASVFLLQVMTLSASKASLAIGGCVTIIFFSGLDIVGSILNWGPRFFTTYDITSHIEWWAGSYQYSSMTTQLFWVPNHALAAWMLVGILARSSSSRQVDAVLPVLLVTAALWSPLSAVGVVPFVALRFLRSDARHRLMAMLRPSVWLPAAAVGAFVVSYLVMDTAGIQKGLAVGHQSAADSAMSFLSQFQFFMLEAGILGAAILRVRRTPELILALIILFCLPFVHAGPANDLVMRASIPSLAVIAISACYALFEPISTPGLHRRQVAIIFLLGVGAITPIHEFARAILLRAWPIDYRMTLVASSCGRYPPHYIARVGDQLFSGVMRSSARMSAPMPGVTVCANPAYELMFKRGLFK